MDPDSASYHADREPAPANSGGPSTLGDPETVRACFAMFVDVTRRQVLHELVANPVLRNIRPGDWLRRFYAHAAIAFSILDTWCDDTWLRDCINAATGAISRESVASPDDLLARVAPALHPSVLDVLTGEVFGQRAPSATSVSHTVRWDLALRRATFTQLIERHGPGLDAYLRYAWGLKQEEATPLLDAAIDEAWSTFGATHPRYDFAPWLIAIVRRQVLRIRRRPIPLQADPTAGDGTDMALVGLSRLTPRLRECLVLAELASLEEADIAQVLGISPALARRNVRAGRRRLTEEYARLTARPEPARGPLPFTFPTFNL